MQVLAPELGAAGTASRRFRHIIVVVVVVRCDRPCEVGGGWTAPVVRPAKSLHCRRVGAPTILGAPVVCTKN